MKATIGHEFLRRLISRRTRPSGPPESSETVALLDGQPITRAEEVYDLKVPAFAIRLRPTGVHSYRVRLGRDRWYTLGRVDVLKPKEARRQAIDALKALEAGKDPVTERRRARAEGKAARLACKAAHTLGTFLETVYTPWAKANLKRGEETVDRLTRVFKKLLDVPLEELTTWHLEQWRTARKKAGIGPKTINRDASDLKALLARAVAWRYLSVHPLREVKPEKVDRRGARIRYLTPAEETKLRRALATRDKHRRAGRDSFNRWRAARDREVLPAYGRYTDHLTPLVLLALNTGLRRGELLALEWTDLDLGQKILTVRGTTTKTGQSRHVELNAEAMHVLKTWGLKAKGLVFPGPDGAVMLDVKTAWGALLDEAGITGFRFHDLRHTFASKLVQRGVPLAVVQELLGHASIVMTQRYAHLAPTQRREAVELLAARR